MSNGFVQFIVRSLQWRHYLVLKSIGLIITLVSLIILLESTSTHRHRSPPFLSIKRTDSSPFLLQNLIIAKINVSENSLPRGAPISNYLDPFISSRIKFTYNDEERSQTSRKWCQAQSKFIRTQDLEPFKCSNIQQFEHTDHVLCLDLFVRNACLVMSIGMGNSRIDNHTFDGQLYEWGGCRVLTFDPYQQPAISNATTNTILIKPNWIYYRLGITASAAVDDNSNLLPIQKLADYAHLDSISTRIDLLKIDIDNANEWNLLDDGDFFSYICRHVKQLILKTKPIHSKRFQHYRIFTMKLNKCFSLLHRHSRLYFLGGREESEWSLTSFTLDLGLFCDEIDMSMYLLVYGHLYLINTKL